MRTRTVSIRRTLQVAIGGLTLLIAVLLGTTTWQTWQRLANMRSLQTAARLSDELFTTAETLAAERSIAFSMLHAPDPATTGSLLPSLEQSRVATDRAVQTAFASLSKRPLPEVAKAIAHGKERLSTVRALRSEVDRASRIPLAGRDPRLSDRWFDAMTDAIAAMQEVWTGVDAHFVDLDPRMNLRTRFKHNLRTTAEYVAREQALIGRLIVTNAAPTSAEQARLLEWHGKVEMGWDLVDACAAQSSFSGPIASYIEDAESDYATLHGMVSDVFYRPGVVPETPYPISVEFWLGLSAQVTDSVTALRKAALLDSRAHVETLAARVRRSIVISGIVLVLALGLCAYTLFVIARRVLAPIDGMVEALVGATEGKSVWHPPTASGQQDEVAKLAHVLEAFQHNTEEIKRTAAALEVHTQALERSNKELDDFAYIASHDLKEPLRGIHNHARFLLDDNKEKLDADSTKRLGRLVYLSQRMERLVNDLLYFSRLGRQELAIQPTDLNEVIRDIEHTLEATLEERRARIEVSSPLPTVTCDAPRVTEVFRNLITNAIKYNDKPEKLVEIGFLPTCVRPGGETAREVFYVRDNGCGIAPEFHEEIFRIFKRLQSSRGNQEDGTGVGLTFVKKIVERHGGRIWLESEAGKGTVFYFTLGEKRYETTSREAA